MKMICAALLALALAACDDASSPTAPQKTEDRRVNTCKVEDSLRVCNRGGDTTIVSWGVVDDDVDSGWEATIVGPDTISIYRW